MKFASDVEYLSVESKPGMGATFTLSLPMSQGTTTITTLPEVGAPGE
jgi:chemotaxis protein histidine kinase CheA